MIEYILLVTFSIVFIIFAYIKLKYPFWNNQPVYHTYDFWRVLYSIPFSIYKYRPIKTKFCDFENVKTYNYLESTNEQIENFVNMLQCYYYSSESIIHNIQKDDLYAYFTGQNEESYISFYNEPIYAVIDGDVAQSTRTLGIISSRYASMLHRIGGQYKETPIYFVDFLCINREHDYKKISRKLLQTHEYNQRIKCPMVSVSLIKKEGDLFEGIVPFIKYNTYTFALRNINVPPLPRNIELVGINNENLDIVFDFLHVQKTVDFKYFPCMFDVFIVPDIGNLIAMIKQRIIFVYCLRQAKDVLAIYFLKDTKTQFEAADGGTLQLVGSISNIQSNQTFYLGFLHSLKRTIKLNPMFKILVFENLGHNMGLFSNWRDKHTPIFENPAAYYLFNLIYPGSPISSERALIIF
jgi:hypothetical protein